MVDRTSGAVSSFSGNVSDGRVSVYDQASGCWIVGRSTGEEPLWLFHQGTAGYLTLVSERPGVFSGTDHSTNHTFDVLVDDGDTIEVLDYEYGHWRRYSLTRAPALVS